MWLGHNQPGATSLVTGSLSREAGGLIAPSSHFCPSPQKMLLLAISCPYPAPMYLMLLQQYSILPCVCVSGVRLKPHCFIRYATLYPTVGFSRPHLSNRSLSPQKARLIVMCSSSMCYWKFVSNQRSGIWMWTSPPIPAKFAPLGVQSIVYTLLSHPFLS